MKKMPEYKLYPIVEKWMVRHFKCFASRSNCGLKYSRCDVVGVRDVGGDLSGEVETVCIEVKKGTEPFATASGQALGYRVYGNRVYLADRRMEPFTQDEIAIASALGIGLIQIRDRKCVEVLSSPLFHPLTRLNLKLLLRMGIAHCQFCGSYFETGDVKSGRSRFSNLVRENFKKSVREKKGIMFWNWEVHQRKARLHLSDRDTNKTYERRFICPDCISRLLKQITPKDWVAE